MDAGALAPSRTRGSRFPEIKTLDAATGAKTLSQYSLKRYGSDLTQANLPFCQTVACIAC